MSANIKTGCLSWLFGRFKNIMLQTGILFQEAGHINVYILLLLASKRKLYLENKLSFFYIKLLKILSYNQDIIFYIFLALLLQFFVLQFSFFFKFLFSWSHYLYTQNFRATKFTFNNFLKTPCS